MKPFEHAGRKYSNADAYRTAKATIPAEHAMGGEAEPQQGDRPMMTEHHADGSHTTTHESGAQKHHATAQELVDHLNQHMPEEEAEIQDDKEPWDEEEPKVK